MGSAFSKVITHSRVTRWSVFAVTLLLVLSVIAPVAIAQNTPEGGLNLVVSPLPLALETKPGEKITEELKVKNEGVETERLKVTIMKFGAEGEDGSPSLLDLEPSDEIDDWVTFSENDFVAEPGVWKSINMTVDPPTSAAFGYYYAVVFSRSDQQIQPNQANLLGAVASLVLLDVQAPGAKREAKLVEFSLPKNVFEFLPAEFNVRMQNSGNVHVAPRGNIFITKGGDENTALLEVNFDKGYILPDSFRKFTASWEDGAPVYKVVTEDGKVVLDDKGQQKKTLSWDNFSPSKIRFGKYTAKIVMVYNDGNSDIPVQGYVSFWVIPWRILGVLLLVALLVFAGLYATIIKPLRDRIKKSNKT